MTEGKLADIVGVAGIADNALPAVNNVRELRKP